MKECPICKTDSSVSLGDGVIHQEYTCNSCQYTWNKIERECVLQLAGLNVFERSKQGCDMICDNCGFYHLKR